MRKSKHLGGWCRSVSRNNNFACGANGGVLDALTPIARTDLRKSSENLVSRSTITKR